MEGMFKDINASRSLQAKWQRYQQRHGLEEGLELSANILTSGFWPVNQKGDCKLPTEVVKKCETFKKFYKGEHSGRKLRFHSCLGTAQLNVRFDSKEHQLIVSTYQMCILFLFNEHPQLNFKQIRELTGVSAEELEPHILSLAHPQVKIVQKKPRGRNLEDSHMFRINLKFHNSKVRIKVPLFTSLGRKQKPDGDVNPDGIPTSVVEARKNWVEAAVVRIMKSRKSSSHQNLMQEVIHQLSTRFQPDHGFIKKRIESLIEREYLKRDAKDRTLYHYLA